MFGSIGVPELLVIFGGLLLVLGGKRLADAGKGLGQAIRSFKEEVSRPADPKEIEVLPAADKPQLKS